MLLASSTAISEALLSLLSKWDINSDQVHAVVTDNGANVKAGLRKAQLPGVPCTIHTAACCGRRIESSDTRSRHYC